MSDILNKAINQLNIINSHLGNGGSVCLNKDSVYVDTSMGWHY
ncbi:hypothetical protein E2R68_08600 [Psychromonas sp. RZ22]|nr:hypothetical protein E2R68_08600 [Psychromonas sp. RZ22]